MALISRLGVVLGLDSAEFSKGMGVAEGKLKAFGATAVAGGIGIAALGQKFMQAAVSGIAFADSINDIAKANEATVSSVLEFSQALGISGGKAEMAGRVLGAFTNKIDEAAEGSDKTREKFQELGVSLKDLGNLDQTDLLKKTLAGLSKIEDPIRRNALAADLFGKGIRGVDLKGMNDELVRISGTMEGSDKAFDKIGDSIDRIDRLAMKMKTDMANNLSEPFEIATTAAEKFYNFVRDSNNALKTASGGFDATDILAPWKAGVKMYTKAGQALLAMREESLNAKNSTHYTPMKDGNYTPSILQGGSPSPKRLLEEGEAAKKLREKLESDQKRLGESLDAQLKTLKLQTSELSGQKSEYEKIKIKFAETAEIDNAKTKNLKTQVLEQAKLYDKEKERVETAQILFDLSVAHTKEMQADLEAQRQFRQGVDDIKISAERLEYEKQLGKLSTTETEKALAYFDLRQRIVRMSEDEVNMSESQKRVLQEQITLLTEAEQLKIQATESFQRQQRTFQAGWDKAYADFVERSTDSAALATDAFNNMTGSMTSALDRFVETGKISFGTLIGSMIKDLLRLAMQAQITGFFKMALGSLGFGGGDNGLTGEGALNWGTGNAWDLSGRADGGDINANTPYLVGERGPELVVPRNNSTVIPNHALGNSMNQQPQTIYNGTVIQNMSAIDTQSGVQFLAKNKNAVFAANQSATRSLPQSR
jgi:lambda family phage tail tape measure protein